MNEPTDFVKARKVDQIPCRDSHELTNILLGEIAAQLLELNERLDYITREPGALVISIKE